MVLVRPVAVGLIERFGPLTVWDRLAGKLVERLPGKLLAGASATDPVELAATNMHRGDAGCTLHLVG